MPHVILHSNFPICIKDTCSTSGDQAHKLYCGDHDRSRFAFESFPNKLSPSISFRIDTEDRFDHEEPMIAARE